MSVRPAARRWAALGAVALAGAGASGALAVGRTRAPRAAVAVVTPSSGPGLYALTIVLRGPAALRNRVVVHIAGRRLGAITDSAHRQAQIEVRVRLHGRTLTVRAVGRRARPDLRVQARLVRRSPTGLHSLATTTTTASSTTPSTTTSTSTTTTSTTSGAPPPPAPRPVPPGPGSPYTRLVWSDDFTQDWVRGGGTGAAHVAVPHTWALDNWGGCGTTPPQLSHNTGASGSAYLTSQGLAIPVTATGASSFQTAQLDTRGIAGESWHYGSIEASIQMPTGVGLCPAFWMLPTSGTGEIDIVEAPSFVSTASQLAPYSIFTLHVNYTTQFQHYLTPPGWNPGQPNVYGLFWTRNSITWTVNYVPYATATPQSLANPALWSAFTSGSFHLLLDVAVGGWPGDPPPNTVYTKPMLVQWVKVFQ